PTFSSTPATAPTPRANSTHTHRAAAIFSNVATVTFTITAPVASNDTYGARKNVTLNAAAPGVLANDTDAGGFSLTAVLVGGPSHGTLSISVNGSLSNTPATDYTGSDSF